MVEIKTDRLLLRAYRDEDARGIVEIGNNKNIAKNMVGSFPHPYTLDDAKEWIDITRKDDNVKTHFAVDLDGEVIGTVSFNPQDEEMTGTAIAGYWIGEDYWGKGYGTEAFKAMVDYAFKNFDIRRVEASTFSWNVASAKLLEKCGFKKEGVLRQKIFRFGEVGDAFIYGLLREDWKR